MVVLPVGAQSFLLGLTTTPDPIRLGSNIVYHLSVTNASGFNLNPGIITSVYDAELAEFVGATNRFGITNAVGRVVFSIDSFSANEVFQIQLELRGTNVGRLTNTFTITIADQGQTVPASTNAVSTIEPPPETDLSVSIESPVDGVFPGDPFTYGLVASNAGPATASGVVVSNLLPSNVLALGLHPPDSIRLTNGVVLFAAGMLTNQASAQARVTLLATNAADTNLILASIYAPDISDTNPANNSVTSNVPILRPDTNAISITILSAQHLNPQTGWVEQRVGLRNISTSVVDSVRLLVQGLTNALVNATGTNSGVPYAAHGSKLAPGDEVELILEYADPSRMPGPDPLLSAYGTPPLNLAGRPGSAVRIDRVLFLQGTGFNNGRILLEWPAEEGLVYQVILDQQANFSTAQGSLPLVSVPESANRVQWLDYGPPRTPANPPNTTSRFYRVIAVESQ